MSHGSRESLVTWVMDQFSDGPNGHLSQMVAAWRSGNIVGRINEVTLRRGPVRTGMDDRLRRTNHLSISPSHLGQFSLLLSPGREKSTS